MSRAEKLYERLDQTEADYTALLQKEIEAVLDGELGNYLGQKLCDDWYQRISRKQDDRSVALQDMEKIIRGLRAKLGETSPGHSIGIVDSLVQRIKKSGNWSPGTNKKWLQEALSELPLKTPLSKPKT